VPLRVTDDYVASGGRAELERRVTAPMLPPATRALFGQIGVASPARFLHVLGLGSGVGRLEPDGTVVASSHGAVLVVAGTATPTDVSDDVEAGPGPSLAELLRATGLEDVDVDVDPLPLTVQAWGRAPAHDRLIDP
jgi:hypothetical protein